MYWHIYTFCFVKWRDNGKEFRIAISTIQEALCLFCCDFTQNAVFRFHASKYYQVLPRNLEGVT